ncbi:hypothetical protein G6L37_06420 [Agrobacterium rubi]|nr:hypothetical protein [Agrobacterium rubi]NTF24997.1 hypothetical protein [Agrobacterium rubi]
MTIKVSAFIDSARTRARAIKARQEELGTSITLAQAYELLAASEGHRTWAAMRAAGESSATITPAETAMDTAFGTAASNRYFSIEVFRRISLDSHDAQDEFDVPALLKEAYRDLSYVFFDGEEYPSMRFRGTNKIDADEYSFTADIEMSPGTDIAWHVDRIEKAENVLKVMPGYTSVTRFTGDGDALFSGTGARSRDLPWLPESVAVLGS